MTHAHALRAHVSPLRAAAPTVRAPVACATPVLTRRILRAPRPLSASPRAFARLTPQFAHPHPTFALPPPNDRAPCPYRVGRYHTGDVHARSSIVSGSVPLQHAASADSRGTVAQSTRAALHTRRLQRHDGSSITRA